MMKQCSALTPVVLLVSITGCSKSKAPGPPIYLPTDDKIASIELRVVPNAIPRLPTGSQAATSQPGPIIVTDGKKVASTLQPLRGARSTTPHKCAHVGYLDIVQVNGETVQWMLRPGHGDQKYDISGPGGWYTFDSDAFDQALREAGAEELADALLPR